jgi:hypothetical protein
MLGGLLEGVKIFFFSLFILSIQKNILQMEFSSNSQKVYIIFFFFCDHLKIDFHQIYGSDELAMKAASNELAGLKSYLDFIFHKGNNCILRIPLTVFLSFIVGNFRENYVNRL